MKNFERWVVVNGYPNYEVSTMGRIRNRKTGRLRKAKPITSGRAASYHRILQLYRNSVSTTKSIHRLVGENFLPMTGGCILHRDENLPPDEVNSLQNLYVGSLGDNARDCRDKGRLKLPDNKGSANSNARLCSEDVRTIRQLHSDDSINHSVSSLMQLYGVSKGCIQGILSRRNWRHI